MEAGRHHPSDVVASAAIAIGANLLFTRHRAPVSLALEPSRAAILVTIAW